MKSFIKGITFCLLLFIILETTCYIMLPNKKSFYKYGTDIVEYDILSEEPDTIDVVFLGDSLIYSSISPMVIWNEYGFTSFDCAGPALTLKNAYKHLNAAIKSQHPKVVMMEADLIFRDSDRKYFKYKDMLNFKNYLPLSKYHNNWKRLFSTSKNENKLLNVEKGYKYITKKKPMKKDNGNMDEIDTPHDIPKGSLKYFDKIISLCEKNNAKLILVSNPSKLSWDYSKRLTMLAIAKDRKIEFIDLNYDNPTNIDWKKETKDKGKHLNFIGAKKVSKYIGNYLSELKILEDHREDEKYNDWNVAYKMYIKNHAKYEAMATE